MPKPAPQSAASICSSALTSSAGVSPRVAMPSMSAGARPASSMAARTASMVRSGPECRCDGRFARCRYRTRSRLFRSTSSAPPVRRNPPHAHRTNRVYCIGRVSRVDITAAHRTLRRLRALGASRGRRMPRLRRPRWCARPVSGRGTVFTYTVNHHPYNPEIPTPLRDRHRRARRTERAARGSQYRWLRTGFGDVRDARRYPTREGQRRRAVVRAGLIAPSDERAQMPLRAACRRTDTHARRRTEPS